MPERYGVPSHSTQWYRDDADADDIRARRSARAQLMVRVGTARADGPVLPRHEAGPYTDHTDEELVDALTPMIFVPSHMRDKVAAENAEIRRELARRGWTEAD